MTQYDPLYLLILEFEGLDLGLVFYLEFLGSSSQDSSNYEYNETHNDSVDS